MKNLKLINEEKLKDWAKEILQKKILLIWLMFHLKKKLLEEL